LSQDTAHAKFAPRMMGNSDSSCQLHDSVLRYNGKTNVAGWPFRVISKTVHEKRTTGKEFCTQLRTSRINFPTNFSTNLKHCARKSTMQPRTVQSEWFHDTIQRIGGTAIDML